MILAPVLSSPAFRPAAGSLFPWGNTPAPYLWTPVSQLTGYSDGEHVLTWKDQSGNGRDLASIVGSVYTTAGGPASKPFLQFGGNPYTVPSLAALTAATMFVVFRNNSATNGNGAWQLSDVTDGTFLPYVGDSNVYDSFCSTVRKEGISGGGGFTDAWHLYQVDSTNGLWRNRLDRTQLFTTATNTFSGPASGVIGNIAGFVYAGKIADVILFNSVLSTGDRTTIENWINTQYGI